eukprot:TRINITY_DN21824_c0_g1_i2.p1 TRINITY_DN21824_c0_g1~~TRINITY_DN21824_c0_g1_i2.p1  ORF type:complete len:582 (-),score=127.10 TRINITY_DN21824_c0_g1_i2:82-1827(-)
MASMSGGIGCKSRPNILFVYGEDWGRYASIYAEKGVTTGASRLCELLRTPHFDRVAREGALFLHARTPAPGCNPARSAVFSGRHFFQTGLGAIEQGTEWDNAAYPTWPLLLEQAGYALGYSYEGDFGKTNARVGGERCAFHPAGKDFGDFSRKVTAAVAAGAELEAAKGRLLAEVRGNFQGFLASAAASNPGAPWLYIWGPTTTHRGGGWARGSGKALWGIDPEHLRADTGRWPGYLPDDLRVREDYSDYLGEVCALDAGLGQLLVELEARGELDRTLIVVTGDHGAPGFPRGKATLYDAGCQVALALRWPGGGVAAGQVLEDLVSTMELAPAMCEAAGAPVPGTMTAPSLLPLATSSAAPRPVRDCVVSGLERHVSIARPDFLPFPQRALRTRRLLYIVHPEPDRWPAGDPRGLEPATAAPSAGSGGSSGAASLPPEALAALASDTMVACADFDASPTKAFMLERWRAGDAALRPLCELAFGRRPAEELYDVLQDPDCMKNLAGDAAFAATKRELRARLDEELRRLGDPRWTEPRPCRFDREPYAGPFKKYTTPQGVKYLASLERIRSTWRPAKDAASRL